MRPPVDAKSLAISGATPVMGQDVQTTFWSANTRQPALIFTNVVAQRHILGVRPQGAMTPKSNSAEIFVRYIYSQVSSSYVRKLSCWQTHTQTNIRRWKYPTLYATTLGNEKFKMLQLITVSR